MRYFRVSGNSCFAFSAGIVLFVLTSCQSAKVLPEDARTPSSKQERPSQANSTCTVCLGNVSDQEIASHQAYICSQGHCLDRDCMWDQIKSIVNVRVLEDEGLSCGGRMAGQDQHCGEACQDKIPLAMIRELLTEDKRIELDKRLAEAKSHGNTDQPQHQSELERLSYGIEDAFNLCCPKEGCHSVLDKIEGCNAATCSNEACKTKFCYLCLEPQPDSQTAHAHAREHSGNYWEQRPGFTERYHWLMARKKLDYLFSPTEGSIDLQVRAEALNSRRALLQENKMWPFPAGIPIEQWIQQVEQTKFSQGKKWYHRLWPWGKKDDRQRKIELLQNESIFRQQKGDTQGAEIVAAELGKLGGVVLASLDIQDAHGGTGERPRAEILPVEDDDERVTPEFAALGNMYQVGNLIWSGVPAQKVNWKDAKRFCKRLGRGSRLPTRQDYEALRAVMGYPNHYNPNLLPDVRGNWFWSSSVSRNSSAYQFYGHNGGFENFTQQNRASVRCVRPTGQRG